MIETSDKGIRVLAPMTIGQASALLQAGSAALAGKEGEVEIDLSAVSDVDSAALAVLLGWQRALGTRATAHMRGTPAAIHSLADMYGLADVLALS